MNKGNNKFDYAIKWYMHKAESVPKNETHEIPWDTKSRLGDNLHKKKNLPTSGLCRSNRLQSVNEKKRKEWQVLKPCLRTKKVVKLEGDSDTNCKWHIWNGH